MPVPFIAAIVLSGNSQQFMWNVTLKHSFPLYQVRLEAQLQTKGALVARHCWGTRLMDLPPIEKRVHHVVCPFCSAELTVASSIETIFCPLCDNELVIENGVVRKPTAISLVWDQLPRLRTQMEDWPCPVSCALNKPMREHSDEEFVKCFVEFATQGRFDAKKK